MESACRNKEDVVCLHGTVLGHDRRALHDWQDITLHALPGNIVAAGVAADCHLVNLIQEHDAAVFSQLHGSLLHFLHVHQLHSFFLLEQLPGLLHGDLALLAALRHHAADHVLQVVPHAFQAGACKHAYHGLAAVLDVNLDNLVLVLAGLQLLAAPLTARLVLLRLVLLNGFLLSLLVVSQAAKELAERIAGLLRLRHQHVQDALLGHLLGLLLHVLYPLLADHADGGLCQIPDDGLHVPAHIAHLGKLGGLNLDERRVHQLCQAAGNLGLAHAGGADHEDVLRHDVILHAGIVQLPAAPAVPEGNSHCPLCLLLAYDIFIQCFYNLSWCLLVQ